MLQFSIIVEITFRKIEIELRRKAEEEIHKNDIFLSQVSVCLKTEIKYILI